MAFVILWPASLLQAQSNPNQPPLQFCPIIGLPAAEITSLQVDDDASTISGELAIVNPTTAFVPGTKIAVAVYTSAQAAVPAYWTVLPEEVVLQAQNRMTVPFSLSTTQLPAGDYVVRAYVAQGDTELIATALRGYDRTQSNSFTKVGGGTGEAPEVTVVGATVSNGVFTVSTSSVPVAVSITAADDTPLHTVVSRHQLPLGDSVYVDTTGVGSASYDWSVPDGPYYVHITSPVDGTLTPFTEVLINVGQTKDKWITVYPYISIIGLSAHPIVDDTTATVCLGNYSPDGHLVSVPTEAVQVDFQVLNSAGQVVDSKQPQTPRLQNYAEFALNSITPDSSFKAVLSTERVYNADTDGPDFVPVETIAFTHNCDQACQQLFAKSPTDFANNKSVQTSFWYFAGIVIAAALLMLLMLRRLDQPVESVSYKSPDELQ